MLDQNSLKALANKHVNIDNYPNISPESCHLSEFLFAGEGEFGLKALRSLQEIPNKNIVGLITESDLENNENMDIPCLSVESAAKKYAHLPVICASNNNFNLAQQLFKYFSQVYLFRHALPDITKNIRFMADEKSKQLLQTHGDMIHHNVYVNHFSDAGGTQYHHEKVAVEPNENILCIGPYLGNPLKAFDEQSNHQFVAHCLEANPYVYAQLCRNIVLWGFKDCVTPVCAGAWSSSGMVAFAGESHTGGGNIDESQEEMSALSLDLAIYAYSVDDYLSMTGFLPTLIESGRIGIATDVIAGAKNYIQQYKPKLILLDYPQSNTPAMLKTLVPEYKIYYSECNRINYGTFFATI